MGCYESAFTALPVEWLYFRVQDGAQPGTALLKWATASETNNDRFEVQRSSTGRAWETIGQVAAYPTSGSTNNYQWTDERPISGYNLYRLRQVDFDGSFDFSAVKTWFLNGTSAGLIVYPSPASEYLWLLSDQDVFMHLYDQLGRQQLRAELRAGETTRIDVSDLPAGSYVVRVENEVRRIVIDH